MCPFFQEIELMADDLEGNCLVAQSGGPTSVINASLAGVITEALNHECIEEVYGGLNGIQGILQEEIVDLAEESQQTIRGLRSTPASALSTCRFKLKKLQDCERAIEVFQVHNIRFFFYIGGNDSQDTANRLSKLSKEKGHEMRIIGIPKTIDNDLVGTDHCPGYGSVIKYVATTVKEIAQDNEAMGRGNLVMILEVMGRSAGWIAAGASLAKRRDHPHDPPHLIYLPEVAFSPQKYIEDVKRILKTANSCFVVVGEGLIDSDGNHVTTSATQTDAFGHSLLGGVGEYLGTMVEQHLGVDSRITKLGYAQRAAIHLSSQVDSDESFAIGQAAVRAAVNGETDKMVTLVRSDSDQYGCDTGLCDLEEVANNVKNIPQNWINEDGISLNFQYFKYALPLVQGELPITYENGVPKFVHLDKYRVDKKLAPYTID